MKNEGSSKRLVFIFSMIMLVVAGGCGNANPDDLQQKSGNDYPAHITRELEPGLNIESDVSVDMPEQLYTYHSKYIQVDPEKMIAAFFPNEENVTTEIFDDQSYNCVSSDEKRRVGTEIGITYIASEYLHYPRLLENADVDHQSPESFRGVESEGSLAFLEPEEAKNLVRETAEKFDLRLDTEPYVFYALDGKKLDTIYWNEVEEIGNEQTAIDGGVVPDYDFTNDDGCYYMLWNTVDPHFEKRINTNIQMGNTQGIDYATGNYAVSIVSKEGLVYFKSGFQFTHDEGEPVDIAVDLEDAISIVQRQYENVILEDHPVVIDQIALREVTVRVDRNQDMYKDQWKTVPAWCIRASYSNDQEDGVYLRRYFLIDVTNGEVLL